MANKSFVILFGGSVVPDPRFQSVHLEGLPRRDEFRAARARLEAGCGQLTLAGDLALLGQREAGDGPTIAYELDSTHSYFIQDGERVYPLQLGVNSIGRLPDNSVVIRDECVSRRHCAIVIHRNGMCELHDVASKNGTVVNGKKIHGPTRLHPGDKISLCSRQIVFLVQNQNPNSPSPDS